MKTLLNLITNTRSRHEPMKKIIDLLLLAILISFTIWIALVFRNSFIDLNNSFKEKIGYKVILLNDTLTIVDYSLWNETYILENGVIISKEFAN